jgi:hypothetical protein
MSRRFRLPPSLDKWYFGISLLPPSLDKWYFGISLLPPSLDKWYFSGSNYYLNSNKLISVVFLLLFGIIK